MLTKLGRDEVIKVLHMRWVFSQIRQEVDSGRCYVYLLTLLFVHNWSTWGSKVWKLDKQLETAAQKTCKLYNRESTKLTKHGTKPVT